MKYSLFNYNEYEDRVVIISHYHVMTVIMMSMTPPWHGFPDGQFWQCDIVELLCRRHNDETTHLRVLWFNPHELDNALGDYVIIIIYRLPLIS